MFLLPRKLLKRVGSKKTWRNAVVLSGCSKWGCSEWNDI